MRQKQPKNPKESQMSHRQAVAAVANFAERVHRWGETSSVPLFDPLPQENLAIVISVEGGFGVADDFFEAMRVLGGYKKPRE
jgi:hypothetical protein